MPRIAPDSIRRIRESVDVVELIQEVLPLTRAGSYFKCSCPFHQDKTPSLMVSPARQTWRCYSCNAGGSVIDFLIAYEKLEFMEAIQRLSERSGVPIEYEGGGHQDAAAAARTRDRRQRLMDAMAWAQKHFTRLLFAKGPGEEALAYLRKRGLDDGTIREWGLGYAPDSFDQIMLAGTREFQDARLLDECGLTRVSEQGKRFDFFRHRLMFPIRDRQGRVVAFGARKLREEDMGGKYINSPASPIYDKAKVLYALDRLPRSAFNRARPAPQRLAVVVEGYMDVIACHRAGVDCAVAPCGTAISPDQLRTLSPYANRMVLLMDGDAAGQASMERVAGEVVAQGLNVLAATLPDGKDPDEFLTRHGPEELVSALVRGRDLYSFKLAALASRYQLRNPAEKAKAIGESIEVVAAAHDPILQGELVRRTGEFFGVPEAALLKALRGVRPARDSGQTRQGPAVVESGPVPVPERAMLVRFLTHPELIRPVSEFLQPDDFESRAAAEVCRVLMNTVDEFGPDAIDEEGRVKGALVLDQIDAAHGPARRLMLDLMEGDGMSASTFVSRATHSTETEFDLHRSAEEIRWWVERQRRRRGIGTNMAAPLAAGGVPPKGEDEKRARLEAIRSRNRR